MGGDRDITGGASREMLAVAEITDGEARRVIKELKSLKRQGKSSRELLFMAMAKCLPVFEDARDIYDACGDAFDPWKSPCPDQALREIQQSYYPEGISSRTPTGKKFGPRTALFEFVFCLLKDEAKEITRLRISSLPVTS